jgi:translation initiation factor IF-2
VEIPALETKFEKPKPVPPRAEPPRERIFTPKPDDRPRQSYGRDDRPPQTGGTFTPRVGANGAFIPKPRPEGGYPPRVGANGAFIPKPRPEGGYPPRVGANGAFIPKPRPEGQGPITRPSGYRPSGGGGGYGAQRPVTEKDIKKQLLVTPTQQKERVSNYDPNKTDLRRREKVAESQAEDKKNKNKKALLTGIVPGAELDDFYSPQGSYGRRPKKLKKMLRPDRIIIEEAVVTGERVSIKTLAEKIGKPGAEIIKKLMLLGVIATINQDIDFPTAALIAGEFGITLNQELEKSFEERMVDFYGTQDDMDKTRTRPPVVTIMGHVDHGKTSLLDAIRSTKVAAGEAGGITQHIGAYSVEIHGRPITFLDTPGHEAFTSMRARGAQATDIAILVIAADDGVMPQTIEAINHAKAAKVPIIVALNKIDLPNADPDRIKQQLTEYGLVAEEWGGETVMAPVSAVTKQGLEHLLEMILLVADVQELKANPDAPARGIVVEARLDKWRGPVATILVQNGTLRTGDYVVAGTVFGRVRAMNDDVGKRLYAATPAMPVELMGLSETPEAGDIFYVVADERLARQVAGERKQKARSESIIGSTPMKLEDLFNRIEQGEVIDLNIIIRADVRGSAEAVKSSLEKLSNDKVRIKTLQSGVGSINENDIMLAAASSAIVIGFNVRPDSKAADAAEREGVDVRTYRIIYQAIEDMEKAMKGLLKPEFREVVLGHAEIRNVIRLSSVGNIAGCYVTDGKASRASQVRLLRDGVVVVEGKLGSLKRFKDDVREVEKGYECGMSIDGYSDIKEGDIIEFFAKEEIKND